MSWTADTFFSLLPLACSLQSAERLSWLRPSIRLSPMAKDCRLRRALTAAGISPLSRLPLRSRTVRRLVLAKNRSGSSSSLFLVNG